VYAKEYTLGGFLGGRFEARWGCGVLDTSVLGVAIKQQSKRGRKAGADFEVLYRMMFLFDFIFLCKKRS
jgi:hypothetical protein